MSEQEKHDFDGIIEQDNPLPGWWLGIFWVTIGFAIFYVPYYHWLNTEKLPEQALALEQARIAEIREANKPDLPNSGDAVAALQERYESGGWKESAKTDFNMYCMACHAADGGGGIGPNFTDDYYLHGGKITDFIRTINEGVPDKGMVSWKAVLKPEQIEGLAFYIKDLRGTTPANPKEPQGQLVDEAGEYLEQPEE